MCFQFVVLLIIRPDQIVPFMYQDVSYIKVTFNIRNWILIGLGGEKVVLRNAAEYSVIADLCHVVRDCGYRSYVGRSVCLLAVPRIKHFSDNWSFERMWDVLPYNLVYSYESCRRTSRCSTILQTTGLSTKLKDVTFQETFTLTRKGVRRRPQMLSVVFRALAQIQ